MTSYYISIAIQYLPTKLAKYLSREFFKSVVTEFINTARII